MENSLRLAIKRGIPIGSGQGQSQQRPGVFEQTSLLGSPQQGEEASLPASPPLPVSWAFKSSSFPTSHAQNLLGVGTAPLTDLREAFQTFSPHPLSSKSWHFCKV